MTKPVITSRTTKGAALTYNELDTNFTNLRDATVTVAGDSGSVVNELNGSMTIAGGTALTTSVAGSILTVNLDNTAVTPGSYTNANITVDAQGRITAAANGTPGGGSGLTIETINGNSNDPTMKIVLVGIETTGPASAHTDTALSYNASTNTLISTNFSGNIAGGTGFFNSTITANSAVVDQPKLHLTNTSINSIAWTTQGLGLRVSSISATDTSSTGVVAQEHLHSIEGGSISSTNNINITNSATLYIGSAPTAGSNTTMTNRWGLLVNAPIRVANNISVGGALYSSVGAGSPIIDAYENATSYANGATVAFPNFSGMIIINRQDSGSGNVALWLVGSAAAVKLGDSIGDQSGIITSDGSINGYRWENNTGGTITVSFAAIRTRTGA